MEIKCFGIAKDITNQSKIICADESISTVKDLRKWINSTYAEFNNLAQYMIAVNQEYGMEDQEIKAIDEIAIIPPVSGG